MSRIRQIPPVTLRSPLDEDQVRLVEFLLESLILAQDERWRRASYMQVERGPISGNTEEDLVANG